jgi:proton-coupled amino acid transporter
MSSTKEPSNFLSPKSEAVRQDQNNEPTALVKEGAVPSDVKIDIASEQTKPEPESSPFGRDGVEFEENPDGASVIQSIFNMSKLFIGIGILATPHAFDHAGIWGGSIGIFCVTILCIYTIFL